MCRKTRYILLPVTIYAINVDIYVVVGDNICPATKYAVRIIRDGEKGVWRWGKREIVYLSLHCHHQNDSCIQMGSDESHFNISLIVRNKVTRQCPRTTTFEKNGEPKRYRTEVCLFTSLNALPLGQTGSLH